jgi:hypothetical protein
MRRALVLLALLSCATYRVANAQRALGQSVTLPSGVTVARVCKQMTEDGVLVSSLDKRELPASSAQYFVELSQIIARRVAVPAEDPPLTVVYGALLMRDGTLTRQFPVRLSGHRALDTRIADALATSPSDGDRTQERSAMPDSLHVLLTFGQHDDGSPSVASHTRCPVVAYPDNPLAEMPARSSELPRSLTVRAVVSPLGRVDTSSVRVDDASDERLIAPAMAALSQMRFVPAEFDGAKVPERIEIVVRFAPSDRVETRPTR